MTIISDPLGKYADYREHLRTQLEMTDPTPGNPELEEVYHLPGLTLSVEALFGTSLFDTKAGNWLVVEFSQTAIFHAEFRFVQRYGDHHNIRYTPHNLYTQPWWINREPSRLQRFEAISPWQMYILSDDDLSDYGATIAYFRTHPEHLLVLKDFAT